MESDRVAIKLLEAAAVAQVADAPLDVAGLAAQLDVDPPELQREIEDAVGAGLMLVGDQLDAVPLLLDAGRQYIGRGGEHAADLVPPAFAAAVDELLALDLYAAAVALMARLSAGDHAGCVGEEIVAVHLVEEARMILELDAEKRKLTDQELATAADEVRGLFGLFVDGDVLAMFEMDEPTDAATGGRGPVKRRRGVSDRRVEAWFRPFDGTLPTGYLADRSDDARG